MFLIFCMCTSILLLFFGIDIYENFTCPPISPLFVSSSAAVSRAHIPMGQTSVNRNLSFSHIYYIFDFQVFIYLEILGLPNANMSMAPVRAMPEASGERKN